MENKRKLTYHNCFCCSKTFNVNDLIEMKSNSIVIAGQTLDFFDLILDTCFVAMDSSSEFYICCDCKDHLVHFHIFKKNIKRYKSFENHIKTAKLFLDVEEMMNSEDYRDVASKTIEFEDLLIRISFKINQNCFEGKQENLENAEACQVIAENLSHEQPLPPEDPLTEKPSGKRKAEQPAKLLEFDVPSKKVKKSLESTSQDAFDSPLDVSLISTPSGVKNLSKWNTNSSLTEVQKNWILDTAKKSQIKEGNKIVFKCSECGSNLSSSWVLRKHLRDVHILNPQKNPKINRRGKDFLEEVRSCKVAVELEDGTAEFVWKCKRCGSEMRSESGCIKHLLYLHIKNTSIDPAFIARCKIAIEYDDPGSTSEFGWRCPECGNFYKSAVGLKNHCKLEHSEVDFNSEKHKRKIREATERSQILREEEKQSEIILETEEGQRKIWQCLRCSAPRYFRSESGFKNHLRHDHLKNLKIDEKKIARCQIGKLKLWQCPLCDVSTKTKEGFISHVNQEHPGEFEADEPSRAESEPLQSAVEKRPVINEEMVTSYGGALKPEGYKFSCNECGLFFSKHYPTHIAAHETMRQLTLNYKLPKCEDCRVLFCRDEDIVRHQEWHEGEVEVETAYPLMGLAYFGGKEFKQPAGTADNALESENTWKCGHCLAMFWDEIECAQHLLLMHIEVLVCPIDNLEFFGSRGLTQFCSHMKNKHPELFPNLKFPCTYCRDEFQSGLDKLSHMKRCSAKNLECDECGKKFFSKVKLAHHLKIEKGLLSYECLICDKKCLSSMDLKLHVIGSHTDSRPYPCTFEDCDKAFKTSAARSSHMESHSDVVHKCGECSKDFKKRAALLKHIKMSHKIGI